MEYLRNWLLQNGEIQLYESILNYFSAPDRFDIQAIVDSAPEDIRAHLQKQLDEAIRLFATEKTVYQANYTYGQIIIWNEVLKAYRILEQQKSIIEKAVLSPDVSNYAIAMSEVKNVLFPYSRMQIALSDLEETLGVDRFLDRVSEGTFLVLKSILDDTKKIVEKKTEKYAISLLDKRIAINKPTQSYIELLSEYDIYSEKICVGEDVRLAIKVHNLDKSDNTQILQIEHDNELRSYNLLFSFEDQKRLSASIDRIRDVGAYYVLSNAKHETIKEIFQRDSDSTIVLSRTSLIGGRKAYRGKTEEYLFTNITGAERIVIDG